MRTIFSCLAALAVFLASVSAASAAFPGRNGKFAITVETTDEFGEIGGYLPFVVDKDGSDRERISGNGSGAAFSPRGRRIVYAHFGGDYGLRLRRTDGRGRVKQLTGGWDEDPDWAPGGRHIVFSRGYYDEKLRIYNRGRTRPLTVGSDPAWSVKGWIAFERSDGIYVIRPNGNGLRRVVEGGSNPDWSPNGERIVFSNAFGFIGTVRADGSGLRTLRPGDAPSFSPDGHKVVYNKGGALYTMGSGGKRPRIVPAPLRPGDWVVDTDWQPRPPPQGAG